MTDPIAIPEEHHDQVRTLLAGMNEIATAMNVVQEQLSEAHNRKHHELFGVIGKALDLPEGTHGFLDPDNMTFMLSSSPAQEPADG